MSNQRWYNISFLVLFYVRLFLQLRSGSYVCLTFITLICIKDFCNMSDCLFCCVYYFDVLFSYNFFIFSVVSFMYVILRSYLRCISLYFSFFWAPSLWFLGCNHSRVKQWWSCFTLLCCSRRRLVFWICVLIFLLLLIFVPDSGVTGNWDIYLYEWLLRRSLSTGSKDWE